jgi:hypothetical protein
VVEGIKRSRSPGEIARDARPGVDEAVGLDVGRSCMAGAVGALGRCEPATGIERGRVAEFAQGLDGGRGALVLGADFDYCLKRSSGNPKCSKTLLRYTGLTSDLSPLCAGTVNDGNLSFRKRQ